VATLVTEEDTSVTIEPKSMFISRPGTARTTEYSESPRKFTIPSSQFKPKDDFFISPRDVLSDYESEPAESHRNMLPALKIVNQMAPIANLAPISKKVYSINIDESSSSYDKKTIGNFQSNLDLEENLFDRLTPVNRAGEDSAKNRQSLLNIVDLEAPEGTRREQVARSTLPPDHIIHEEEDEDNYFNEGQVFHKDQNKAKKAWKERDGLGNMLDASFSNRETPTNFPINTTPGVSNKEFEQSRLQAPENENRFSAHVALFGKNGRHSANLPGTEKVKMDVKRGEKHHTYNQSHTPTARGEYYGEVPGGQTPGGKPKNFIQKSWDAGKQSIFRRTASLTLKGQDKKKEGYENLDENVKTENDESFQNE